MQEVQGPLVEKIPIRATILSALSTVPYLVILVLLYLSNLPPNRIGMGNRIVVQLLLVFRCPLVATVMFKKKQNIAAVQNLKQRNRVMEINVIASSSI